MSEIDQKLDASGLTCPMPLLKAKQALNGIEAFDVDKSYRWEQGFTLEAYTMEDSQESRDAFVEKRDVTFKD